MVIGVVMMAEVGAVAMVALAVVATSRSWGIGRSCSHCGGGLGNGSHNSGCCCLITVTVVTLSGN